MRLVVSGDLLTPPTRALRGGTISGVCRSWKRVIQTDAGYRFLVTTLRVRVGRADAKLGPTRTG
jgi:hypothetical protein